MPAPKKTVTKTKGADGSKTRTVRKANGAVKTKTTTAGGKTTKSVSKTKFTKKGIKKVNKTTNAKGVTTRSVTNAKGRTVTTKKKADGTVKSRTKTKATKPTMGGPGGKPATRGPKATKSGGPTPTPYRSSKGRGSGTMTKTAVSKKLSAKPYKNKK